jgi:hypothetical protein
LISGVLGLLNLEVRLDEFLVSSLELLLKLLTAEDGSEFSISRTFALNF